jgi:hypothetical protein
MNDIDNVYSYQLQSSVDQSSYLTLAIIRNNGDKKLSYNDDRINEGTVYYRLMMIKEDGSMYYSQIVPLTRSSNEALKFISLQPNPSTDNLSVILYAENAEPANVIIYNTCGQQIFSNSNLLNIGYNKLNLTVAALPAGAYYFKIITKDFEAVKTFIKR